MRVGRGDWEARWEVYQIMPRAPYGIDLPLLVGAAELVSEVFFIKSLPCD